MSTLDKLTPADLAGHLIAELPDTPEIPSGDLKALFDDLARNVIVPKLNEAIDKINSVERQAEGHGLMTPEDKEKLDELFPTLVFTDITIPTTAWTADETSANYPYKADIVCAGAAADVFADVVFSPDNADNDKLSAACDTSDGIVTVYASDIPLSAVVIKTLKCEKVVTQP